MYNQTYDHFADYQQYLQFSLVEYREFQLRYLKEFVKQVAQNSKHFKEQSIKVEINSYEEFALTIVGTRS